MSEPRCDRCRFWTEMEFGQGLCRRRCPQIVNQGGGVIRSVWPTTEDEDCCGEFEAGWKPSLIRSKADPRDDPRTAW